MGLRNVRSGERVHVVLGPHTGKYGKVTDVGSKFAMVEFDGGGSDTIELRWANRIVDLKTDKEIDAPLAREVLKETTESIDTANALYDQAVADRLAEEAAKSGLPEVVQTALGLLPKLAGIVGLDDAGRADVDTVAKALLTAATLLGVGKQIASEIKKLSE